MWRNMTLLAIRSQPSLSLFIVFSCNGDVTETFQ